MKESKTTYSYLIEHMQEPSFQKVWNIAYDFVRKLPNELCNELHDELNRGVDILDSEPLLQMYIYSFGKMHNAKLQFAFEHLRQNVKKYDEVELIDYGCGQGIASICYHDFILKNNLEQKVKKITLIEPSEMALSRAELLCSRFYPNTYIVAINKQFDELTTDDIDISKEIPTIHLLSNVLDVESYDLSRFSQFVKEKSMGNNEYVLVSPIQNAQRTRRLKIFATILEMDVYFEQYLEKKRLNPYKDWTCAILLCTNTAHEEGVRNIKGDGINLNIEETILSLTKAAQMGHIPSIERIISLFKKGNRIEHFSDEQYDVFVKAAKLGVESISSVTQSEINTDVNSVKDSENVIYSNDGKIVLCAKIEYVPKTITRIVGRSISMIETGSVVSGGFSQYVIPDGVRIICDNAFSGCPNLTKITIPQSVNFIGRGAFQNCRKLNGLQLPDNIVYIGEDAFSCTSVTHFTLPTSLQIIDGNPFDHDAKIISLSNNFIVKDDVLYTADLKRLISYCGKSSQFSIPEGVEIIGERAFSGCDLKNITLPSTLRIIESNAFGGCSELTKNISFPESLEEIHRDAFARCTFMNGCLALPNNVKKIDKEAFELMYHVQLITVPKGRADYYKTILPDNFSNQIIDDGYIYDSGLYFNIEKTEIFASADLEAEGISEIVIPESVVKIHDGAFCCIANLDEIRFQNPYIDFTEDVFNREYIELIEIERIIVPKGFAERFKKILPEFEKNIIEE